MFFRKSKLDQLFEEAIKDLEALTIKEKAKNNTIVIKVQQDVVVENGAEVKTAEQIQQELRSKTRVQTGIRYGK